MTYKPFDFHHPDVQAAMERDLYDQDCDCSECYDGGPSPNEDGEAQALYAELNDYLREMKQDLELQVEALLDKVEFTEDAWFEINVSPRAGDGKVPVRLAGQFASMRELLRAVYLDGVDTGSNEGSVSGVSRNPNHICHRMTVVACSSITGTRRTLVL